MAYAKSRAAARSHSLFLDLSIAVAGVLFIWGIGSMCTTPAVEPLAALPTVAPTVKTIARAETSLDNGTASAIVWKSNFAPLLTPSTRRLLDGVVAWVLHRSIRWTWPHRRRKCTPTHWLISTQVRVRADEGHCLR